MRKRMTIALSGLLLLSGILFSQTTNTLELMQDFEIPAFSPVEFLISYFPSELVDNGIELKSYIRSKRFREIRKQFGDVRAADAAYLQALRLTGGNTGLALLYCTLATLDHRVVGIKIPLLNMFLPLTNESAEEFARRINNLPSRLYADSPDGGGGDRDKLQHFFGSAFIANVLESRRPADRIGNFIEWGEDAFIIGGVLDERDMRANRQGSEFGLALLAADASKPALPSYFLKLHLAEARPPQAANANPIPCGAW